MIGFIYFILWVFEIFVITQWCAIHFIRELRKRVWLNTFSRFFARQTAHGTKHSVLSSAQRDGPIFALLYQFLVSIDSVSANPSHFLTRARCLLLLKSA